MRPDQFARVREVVAGALERPVGQRQDWVTDACGDDTDLRAEVESLLALDANTPSLLATGGLGGAAWTSVLEAIAPETPEPPGRRIGPYEIVAVLGEGGMGTVYHARQSEPLRRDVALKLVRRGLDSSRIITRFEVERRTLAQLDHPGIARILDAGADDQGRPFFVMELVRGVPITEYSDVRQLSVRARLDLFLQVCHAVSHAHQKGVLHRDLKPSNVLVTEHDGVAHPKVIDFGVARAIDPDSGGDDEAPHMLTEVGQLVGTPEYMSPEQSGARPGGADTRSDVYSLGVLLYELLTGERPYQLRGLPLSEIQRVIGTEEPKRPSTVRRPSSLYPPRSRELAGDLDTIVLMSLRKEPERRYQGVEPFAADVRRYLEGRPVEARLDTWSYRTAKFVRRHRAGVAVAATAAVALIVFAATMTYQRNRAVDAERRAQAEAETARQVSDFLVGLFSQANPFVSEGRQLTARDLLDHGADRIQQDLRGQPGVQAALMITMSQAYTGLQVPDRAVELATRALDRQRELYGETHAGVATALVALAAAHAARSEADEALPLYREALAMRRALLDDGDPAIIEAVRLLALDLHTLAQFPEAEALYREALDRTRRIRPADHQDVTAALQALGGILHAQGKTDEALTVLREALERARSGQAGPIMTADILSELAVLQKNLGRPADAEPMYREALELREQTFGVHPFTAQSHNNLSVFLRGENRIEDALLHARKAVEIYRGALGDRHRDVGIAYSNLASVLKSLARVDEAEAAYRASLGAIEASMGREYWVYGQVEYNYGVLLRDAGRFAAAEPLIVRGYQLLLKGLGPANGRTRQAAEGAGELYERWGRPAQAAEYRKLASAGAGG